MNENNFYVLKNNIGRILSIKDIYRNSLSILDFYYLCYKYNVVLLSSIYPKNIKKIEFYFKLKNINISIEYKELCFNNYTIQSSYNNNIINKDDIKLLYEIYNNKKNYDKKQIIILNGNFNNINLLMEYLNKYFNFNIDYIDTLSYNFYYNFL